MRSKSLNHSFLIAQTQKIGMSLVAASEDDASNQNGTTFIWLLVLRVPASRAAILFWFEQFIFHIFV